MDTNVRSIAFLDVDGVLSNFSAEAARFLNSTYGLKIPLDFEPSDWAWSDVVPQEHSDWFSKMPTDWVQHAQLYPGAAEFTRNLKQLGTRIILITKVPLDQVVARIHRLNDLGIEFDEILAVSHGQKKSEFINACRARYPNANWFYLEDSFTEMVDVVQNCPNAPSRFFLVVTPYCSGSWNHPIATNMTWVHGELDRNVRRVAYDLALLQAQADTLSMPKRTFSVEDGKIQFQHVEIHAPKPFVVVSPRMAPPGLFIEDLPKPTIISGDR